MSIDFYACDNESSCPVCQVGGSDSERLAKAEASNKELLEALEAFMSGYCVSPSCQKGVVKLCVCDVCNMDRARKAISRAKGGK